MSSNDDSYGRYQRDEQEQYQRLLEQEREAEDKHAWEAYLAERTKLELRGTAQAIKVYRSHLIEAARKRGKTLKEAKIGAEFELAKMKKRLVVLGK